MTGQRVLLLTVAIIGITRRRRSVSTPLRSLRWWEGRWAFLIGRFAHLTSPLFVDQLGDRGDALCLRLRECRSRFRHSRAIADQRSAYGWNGPYVLVATVVLVLVLHHGVGDGWIAVADCDRPFLEIVSKPLIKGLILEVWRGLPLLIRPSMTLKCVIEAGFQNDHVCS